MRWSFGIGRVFGVRLNVHLTFFLVLIWAAAAQYQVRRAWSDAVAGVLFILALFAIVVLHELGHVLTARRFGIPTKDITLLPIGGVARLERMPEKPYQELLVALAGPAVNVCLAAFFWALAGGAREFGTLARVDLAGAGVLWLFVQVNILLAAFNLLPAFPMDGGRVLRALLAMWMSYPVATRLAALAGKGMAFVFIFLGLLGLVAPGHFLANPFLLLIGFFVWMGATQESAMVQMRFELGGISAGDIMIRDFQAVDPEDTIGAAAERLTRGWQQHFPVVEDGKLIGVLTASKLLETLSAGGGDTPVRLSMDRRYETVGPSAPGEVILQRLHAGEADFLPVTEEGNCVGVLTRTLVGQFLAVRASLRPGYATSMARSFNVSG